MIKFILLIIQNLFSKKQESTPIEIEENVIVEIETPEIELEDIITEELDKEESIDTSIIPEVEKEEVEKDSYYQNFLIVVEPGHGADTTETTGSKRTPNFEDGTYLEEYDFNKPTSEYTAKELEDIGFDVRLFAYPKDISIEKRADAYNKIEFFSRMAGKQHIIISIHADAGGKFEWSDAGGTTGFYWRRPRKNANGQIMKDKDGKTIFDLSPEGRELAAFIQKRMVEATGLRDRSWSVERAKSLGANHGILRRTTGVSSLVECAFMTNRKEAELLRSDDFRRLCGKTIALAIKDYADSKRK